MKIDISPIQNYQSERDWNDFIKNQKDSCLYHCLEWSNIIKAIYHHKSHNFIVKNYDESSPSYHKKNDSLNYNILGLLPLIRIQSLMFGNSLVSIPYFDSGGVLLADELVETALLNKAIELAEKYKITTIEIRQNHRFNNYENSRINGWNLSLSISKVRMILDLVDSSELLINSFKPKLRSQIRKPIKEGLTTEVGGIELVDDFYNIFAENMRDLGSPVHSKKFIAETLKAFSNAANVFIVYGDRKPLAGSVTIGFKDTLSNPWASSLRRYSHLAPNMLLYWSMLEFACQQGYKRFDFGRSTPGEGTYKFKEQWGAKPEPLYWYRLSKTSDQGFGNKLDKDKMSKAIEYWKKLPVPLTKIIGPRIRKYISL